MLYYAINSTLQYKSLYISEALLNYENVLGYLFLLKREDPVAGILAVQIPNVLLMCPSEPGWTLAESTA